MRHRPLFPFAVSLQAAALLFEGDGRPALYICAETQAGLPRLYRVPEGCAVKVHAPRPFPPTQDGQQRVFLPAGSRAVFELPQGHSAALSLHSVRLARELRALRAAHGQAVSAWQAARATFEGKAGAA